MYVVQAQLALKHSVIVFKSFEWYLACTASVTASNALNWLYFREHLQWL